MVCMRDIYRKVKVNWTNFIVEIEDLQSDSPIVFEVMPEEYLEFAKNNIRNSNLQSCIEGISNAKRAIECQIDLLINTLGYDYKKFDYPEVKEFINNYYKEQQCDGLTNKLKLLNILGLAPTLIISNIRKLRNLIEHEYKKISYEDVKVAVEVADLFINSSNKKFSDSPCFLRFGNFKNPDEKIKIEHIYIDVPYVELIFRCYEIISLNIRCITTEDEEKNFIPFHEIMPEDKYYLEFIYCLLINEYSILPRIFDCDIEEKYINYEVI